VLGLDHDAPCRTPAVTGLIGKLIEYAAGLGGAEEGALGLDAGAQAHAEQTRILGEAQDEVHTVGFAPSHDVFASSGIRTYHLVHTIRFQLKASGIHLSWEGIRRALAGQDRVTVTLKRADGKTIHIRKATRAEPRQQVIYDALGITDRPGRTEKTIA